MTRDILISDPSLRDGNHAAKHQLRPEQIALYCRLADAAGVPIVEVGHGNGVGASSLQLGEACSSDEALLRTARENLPNSKLGIHAIPGFATIERDLKPAIRMGVDIIRVASHCTEADITERMIRFARSQSLVTYGVLMMSHMADPATLLTEARKLESYGAHGVIIMDSAGAYVPADVTERVGTLVSGLGIDVGFHAHNNLGLAIANSIAAADAGATMLDGCSRGFGAGAGNAQLEVLVAVLDKLGYHTGIDLYGVLDLADRAERDIMTELPTISSTSVVSGLSGVFSGFLKPVQRAAETYGLDARDIFFALGRRKVVAGQEDLILEVAKELSSRVDDAGPRGFQPVTL
jgi:4-hydroxy 2-oxovalerate aldolase